LVRYFHQITTSGIPKPQHLLYIELYFSKFSIQFCTRKKYMAKVFYICSKLLFEVKQNIK
ncbi:hypothetical protein E2320_021801, partial [Naja naja]